MVEFSTAYYKFLASDMTRITGVKLNRWQHWYKKCPELEPEEKASGPGTRNLFNTFDLYKIKLFEYLTDAGFSRGTAAQWGSAFSSIIAGLKQRLKRHFEKREIYIAFCRNVVDGEFNYEAFLIDPYIDKDLYGFDGFSHVDNRLKEGVRDILIINFSAIMREVDLKIFDEVVKD
jgi:hypothetical protein